MSILPAQMHMQPECLVPSVARRRIHETEAIVWVSEPEPGACTRAHVLYTAEPSLQPWQN